MPRKCATSGCTELTDSGICQQCCAEQQYGSPRDYNPDGSRVQLREGETRDDHGHADVVAAQLAEASDEDLEEIGADEDEREIRTDGGHSSSDNERCDHPLSSVERRGEPDWKNDDQTIWYYGFCTNCGADVEVEYQFDDVKGRDRHV